MAAAANFAPALQTGVRTRGIRTRRSASAKKRGRRESLRGGPSGWSVRALLFYRNRNVFLIGQLAIIGNSTKHVLSWLRELRRRGGFTLGYPLRGVRQRNWSRASP